MTWLEEDVTYVGARGYLHKRIKEQPHEIQQIALRNIQGNTFCLLPENFLYSMVKSEEVEIREEALKRILAIR